MQSAMQRNVSHTCAMCSSRCATAHIVTPPVSSAHLQSTPLRLPVLKSSSAVLFSSRHTRRQSRLPSAIHMSATSDYGANWGESPESFIVLGLAHCFEKDDNGKLADRFVIEPISANSLECMATGAKTCFKEVKSVPLGEALSRDRSVLPEEWASATFCDEYDFRCGACARTWSRPHAQDNLMDIVPLGRTKSNFNYNLDEKRVLNFENVVNDDDNIKQDISIDVYGRAEKEEESAEAAAPADKQEEEEELDSLLAA